MKKRIALACFIICLIFIGSIFADPPITIRIFIDNPRSVPFVFNNRSGHGNVCSSLASNLIVCAIINKDEAPLDLQWINKGNKNCMMTLLLTGEKNSYDFIFDPTYTGSTFSPRYWDGKSNVEATLVVGNGAC